MIMHWSLEHFECMFLFLNFISFSLFLIINTGCLKKMQSHTFWMLDEDVASSWFSTIILESEWGIVSVPPRRVSSKGVGRTTVSACGYPVVVHDAERQEAESKKPNRHEVKRAESRMDMMPNGQDSEWTKCQIYKLGWVVNSIITNFVTGNMGNKNALQLKANRPFVWKTLRKMRTRFHSPC